jgi:hypothetical protein
LIFSVIGAFFCPQKKEINYVLELHYIGRHRHRINSFGRAVGLGHRISMSLKAILVLAVVMGLWVIYDACCGSGGMFVQSERFIEAHGGKLGDVSIYGQEANPTTWRR